jgi:uncharacterized protein (DUF58 family)
MADAGREFLDRALAARLARLAVLPRGLVTGSFAGLHKSPHRGSSVEFAEYRKYVPGDDIRHIDWRVYAKSDRFYLKEFEAVTNLRCYLVLDCSGSMAYAGKGDSKFAIAQRLAATLAYLIAHQGDHVGLHCFSGGVLHDIPPRGNPSHLRFIYDTLGGIEPAGETAIVRTLHDLAEKIRRRAMVIVFSDFFTEVEPLLECFQHMRFRNHDLVVFHLLDDRELNLDFDRPIRFVDLESRMTLVTEPSTIQAQYRDAVNRYLATLQRGCRQQGVDYHRVLSSAGIEDVLTRFLLARQ